MIDIGCVHEDRHTDKIPRENVVQELGMPGEAKRKPLLGAEQSTVISVSSVTPRVWRQLSRQVQGLEVHLV